MATPNLMLIDALRRTAKKLQTGSRYEWGHMGSCNCGNLAQEITQMTEAQIHEHALRTREGDWSEQTAEYCAISKLPMDVMITKILEIGLTTTDLKNLEQLSDKTVLLRMPAEKRYPKHNQREDVVLYLNTWANVLEEQLLASLPAVDTLQETPTTASFA
ncbi:MAG: hypothetical protein EAZ55_13670 [Cytophagales bacterium]|nr:MAG: hypothetical protein EAZ55_13670 [Cytophagales bacterium]